MCCGHQIQIKILCKIWQPLPGDFMEIPGISGIIMKKRVMIVLSYSIKISKKFSSWETVPQDAGQVKKKEKNFLNQGQLLSSTTTPTSFGKLRSGQHKRLQ